MWIPVQPALAPNPVELAVVLTRTVPNAASTGVYRQMLTDDGVRVLGPTVGRLSATFRRSGYRSVRWLRLPTVTAAETLGRHNHVSTDLPIHRLPIRAKEGRTR